jgi:hypothetical protein
MRRRILELCSAFAQRNCAEQLCIVQYTSIARHMVRGDKNPFDLKGRKIGPERIYKDKVYTEAEQQVNLTGYIEVPPQYWTNIKYASHIQYYTHSSGYHPGGFVLRNYQDIVDISTGQEKRIMRLQSSFLEKHRNYQSWILEYQDIAKIFVKADALTLVLYDMIENTIKSVNTNIKKLAEHSKKIEARLAALERGR